METAVSGRYHVRARPTPLLRPVTGKKETRRGGEMRTLISGSATSGRIFDSALERRATDGPEKELQEFHKLERKSGSLGTA